MLTLLFSFTIGRDRYYPDVPGARYWDDDKWDNGPMEGWARDEKHYGGIPLNSQAVQPLTDDYGVAMVGMFSPVNTYTYEPNWAPNAI
mmetsp:Transcript_54276/g.126842  ORF Transcript_54276/g.126842 Transcript_54276/m.126842 type:complete len:88 (-) Transcript_54276:77-340(-)